MPHSFKGLLIVAVLVPLLAVVAAFAFNWWTTRVQHMTRRNRVMLFVVLGGVFLVLGLLALVAGGGARQGLEFLVVGILLLVHGLRLRRAWRESLDEPIDPRDSQ